jgi:hypothetical protein
MSKSIKGRWWVFRMTAENLLEWTRIEEKYWEGQNLRKL